MSDSLRQHGPVCQAPLSMWFSRQEYWNGLPCLPPRNPPNPGTKPGSPALQADSLPLSHQGSSRIVEWVAYPFSRGSSQSRNPAGVSCMPGGFFTSWATGVSLLSSIRASYTDNPGVPGGSDGKVSARNEGDLGLIPGSGRSPGEGNGNRLQYSCLEKSTRLLNP